MQAWLAQKQPSHTASTSAVSDVLGWLTKSRQDDRPKEDEELSVSQATTVVAAAATPATADLFTSLRSQCLESRSDLQELRTELHDSNTRWQEQVACMEAEHAKVLRRNALLAEEVTAGVTREEHATAQRQAFGERRRELEYSVAALRRQLSEKTSHVRELSARVAGSQLETASTPSAAEVGAQRDVLRILQRTVAGLQPQLRQATIDRDSLQQRVVLEQEHVEDQARRYADWCGGDSSPSGASNALLALRSRLRSLRKSYARESSRCEELEEWFASDHDGDDGADGGITEECFDEWREALAQQEMRFLQSQEVTRSLRDELSVVSAQCSHVVGEECRLQEAAEQDRQLVDRLRAQLLRSEARNAGLEAEARFLGSGF